MHSKQDNSWEAAKKRCEDIVALRPNYAEAYNNLAILYAKKNDYANALKNYAKAVNLQPNYVIAHHNLGLLFLKHGHIDEAIIQFKNVIELNPLSINAHYYLANCYLGISNLALAKEQYLTVLSFNPEHTDALNNLGVVSLKQEQPQLAIDYLTKALAFDNHHEDARNNLAAIFMQYDRYENAARHYRELLQHYPDNSEYHYNIAVAYMNLGHLEEAIEHFNHVLRLIPDHVASLNNLAAVYWRLDKKPEAIALLSTALEIDPNDQNSRYLLSAATQQEDYTEAPKEYVKNLFDNYAIQYDSHLCQELQYTLPQKIGDLLEKIMASESTKKDNVLDLGCGTGLLGPYLKPYYHRLIGVDLSQKMLDNAEKIKLYHQLICDDIQHFFQETEETFDTITAAEVLEYFGDLHALFSDVSAHLKPRGLFIFSIELLKNNADKESAKHASFVLQETARFAHAIYYIHALAQQYCFNILSETTLSARLQQHQPLSSCLFILENKH